MTGDRFNLEIIYRNATSDPHYAPYCMRCRGLVRMRKVAHLYWRCYKCPAIHDQREFVPEPASQAILTSTAGTRESLI